MLGRKMSSVITPGREILSGSVEGVTCPADVLPGAVLRWSMISSRTRGGAVAVMARAGGLPSSSRAACRKR